MQPAIDLRRPIFAAGFEPATSSLMKYPHLPTPREWYSWLGSNQRTLACETSALPLSYTSKNFPEDDGDKESLSLRTLLPLVGLPAHWWAGLASNQHWQRFTEVFLVRASGKMVHVGRFELPLSAYQAEILTIRRHVDEMV